MRRPSIRLALPLLTIALLASPSAPATPPAAAQSAIAQTIPCTTSPFGSKLVLGHENEIFMGFEDGGSSGNDPGSFGYYRFDQEATGNLDEVDQAIYQDNNRGEIDDLAGTAVDFNGDGKSEFVQAFVDSNDNSQLFVAGPGSNSTAFVDHMMGQSLLALAAGDILGVGERREQVAIASLEGTDIVNVVVYPGLSDGTIAGRAANLSWLPATRPKPVLISIDVGNLDGDRYDDIMVALYEREIFGTEDRLQIRLLYLEYEPGSLTNADGIVAEGLKLRAKQTITVNQLRYMALNLADLTGDNVDEIVLASANQDPSPIQLAALNYNSARNDFVYRTQGTIPSSANGFAMVTGDVDGIIDGQRREEIVLGWQATNGDFGQNSGGLRILVVQLTGLETQSPQLTYATPFFDNQLFTNHLALLAADLDKDNRAEIVAAFSGPEENGGFDTISLVYNKGRLEQRDTGSFDANLQDAPILSAGDWDGDSLHAVAEGKCARVTENQILGAVFVPPFWQNIQGEVEKEGTLGTSVTGELETARSYSYSQSSTSSVYAGGSVGFSFFELIELGGAVRVTAAEEYGTSQSGGTAALRATVLTRGLSFDRDGVAFASSDYRCYSYTLVDNSASIPPADAGIRLCEFVPLRDSAGRISEAMEGSGLDAWDANYHRQTEWVPVTRDWANLALFRGPFTAQSSNGATAARALDNEIGAVSKEAYSYLGGGIASTNSELNPWWQVDLGAVQPITKVRLFVPPASLNDFVVLVSDTDFRTMSGAGDPDSLKGQPGVSAYSLADLGLPSDAYAGLTTTFQTLVLEQGREVPISGRYVRVQRRGTGILELAEVQVFGTNHVEPDRYPLGLCDAKLGAEADSTDYNGDGYFGLRLHNPWAAAGQPSTQCVKVRGRLHWGGEDSPTGLYQVNRGTGSTSSWSFSKIEGGSKLTGSSISSTSSVGIEFDVEGGVLVKAQAGGALERTMGFEEESTITTSWSDSFDLGGSVENFPEAYSSQVMGWAETCEYMFQPYFYEVADESSVGYQQSYTVLDYLVPFNENNSGMLNRNGDLTNCRNGNQAALQPRAVVDNATAVAGQPLSIAVLANDNGNELRLTGVGQAQHGTTSFDRRTVIYTPAAGFKGQDSFTYTFVDAQGQTATGRVDLSVGGAAPSLHPVYLPLVVRR